MVTTIDVLTYLPHNSGTNGFVVNHTAGLTYYSSYSQKMIRSDGTGFDLVFFPISLQKTV